MNINVFGLTVDASGAIKAIRSVTDAGVTMAQSGAKSAQLYADAMQEKLNRVARQVIPETMRAIDALRERQQVLAQSTQAVGSQTMITAEEFRRADAAYVAARASFNGVSEAQKAVTESSGGVLTGFGRVRQGLTSLIAQATGTLPVLDRLVTAFGSFWPGNAVMLGVLAGLAGVALAYRALTRDARDTEAAQDAALKKMREWDRQRHLGAEGQFGADVAGASGALGSQVERQRLIAGVGATGPAGAGVASLLTVFATETRKQFATDVQAVSEGRQALGGEMTKLMLEQREKQATMLADAIKNGTATHAQRLQALQMLREDTALAAQYAKAGLLEPQVAAGSQAATLSDALFPKDKDADRAFQATLQQRMEEYNHFIKEQHAAYKQAGEEAVRDTEQELDRETAIAITQYNEQLAAKKRADKEATDSTIREFNEQQRYTAEMNREWARGLERILTHGLRSWSGFFDSVLALFSNLMRRMEAAGKDGGVLYKALSYGSIAIAGGMAGYDTGQSVYSTSHSGGGNTARGALGGAASGAAMGAMLGSVVPGIGTAVGAIVGGAAGFIGGVLGMGAAAKQSAQQMAEAMKQVKLSMDSLRATVNHDTVGQGIASIEADRQQRIQAVEDAWSGGDANSDRVRWRTAQEREINALEDKRIAQLRDEYALTQKRAYEDLRVRDLASRGLSKEAEALALQLTQQREMEQYVKDGADPATIALLGQVQAQEKLAAATNKATTSALNMVDGYNIVAEAFRASGNTTGMGGSAGYTTTTPFVAPTGPARATPQPTGLIVIENIMQLDGREIARSSKMIYQDEAGRSADGDRYNWGRGT